MIKSEFGEDVLEAWATLDGPSTASLVRVDDLDAVAGPAQRDGHVGQPVLASGRLLVVGDLLGTRLADIDHGFAIEMMIADLGGTQSQQVSRHDGRTCRGGRRGQSGYAFRCAHGRPPSALWVGGPWR